MGTFFQDESSVAQQNLIDNKIVDSETKEICEEYYDNIKLNHVEKQTQQLIVNSTECNNSIAFHKSIQTQHNIKFSDLIELNKNTMPVVEGSEMAAHELASINENKVSCKMPVSEVTKSKSVISQHLSDLSET